MQNFGVTNKEHYGMLWYFWSGQLHSPINAEIRLRRANQIREFCYSYGYWD